MTLLQWQIQSDGVRAFNCHRRTWAAGSGFAEHGHDYCELFWVEDGVMDHVWEGERQRLGVGDLVAIVPGEVHALEADARRSARVVNLSLSADDAAAMRTRYGGGQHIWPWEGNRAQRRHVLSDTAREALRLLVDLADRHLASSRDLLVLGIVHGLSRHARSGFQALESDLRVALLDALEANPTASVADLAHRLRRSREGLTRACSRQSGRPLADLLRDWRLDRAADLLRGSDRSIDDIALSVGFHAVGGFYKAFQRRHGCAPGHWRSQGIEPATIR